jgi:hypothetical protein
MAGRALDGTQAMALPQASVRRSEQDAIPPSESVGNWPMLASTLALGSRNLATIAAELGAVVSSRSSFEVIKAP